MLTGSSEVPFSRLHHIGCAGVNLDIEGFTPFRITNILDLSMSAVINFLDCNSAELKFLFVAHSTRMESCTTYMVMDAL